MSEEKTLDGLSIDTSFSGDIRDMVGKTFTQVFTVDDDSLYFFNNIEAYRFYHETDCCEDVRIEDVCGDLSDLVGYPIITAEERVNTEEWPTEQVGEPPDFLESFTWTFYEFTTVKGSVTVRWLGESNGYYSESVDLQRLHDPYYKPVTIKGSNRIIKPKRKLRL